MAKEVSAIELLIADERFERHLKRLYESKMRFKNASEEESVSASHIVPSGVSNGE